MNNIDNKGVETNEAGIYILLVCLVCTEHGFTFINIGCIHTHAQNPLGVKAQGKQGIWTISQKAMQKYFFKRKDLELKATKTSDDSNILENQD